MPSILTITKYTESKRSDTRTMINTPLQRERASDLTSRDAFCAISEHEWIFFRGI